MQTLRIFISSPGDVADERQIAGKVLERLQGKYWSFVRLDDVFWEQKVIRSTAHYQDELVNPGECEMVVGILWSRLGSLMPEKFRKASGERYQSGTEWELEMAFDAHEQSLAGIGDRAAAKPDIIVYRRNQPRPSFEDPAQEALAAEQITKLEAYLSDNFWFPDGTIKRPVTNYQNLDEFEEKLSSNLEELILRQIPGLKPGFEPPPISGSPFKGLQAFDFADSDRYFGRNREIREIQQRLVASAGKGLPFVLIYGGSGYGKSSLMRAGLAPVLTRPGGSLDDIQGWRRVPFQPAKGTGSLCERLARALIQAPTREEAEHSRHHRHWPLTGLAELVDSRADTPAWDSARLTRHFSDDDQRVFAVAAVVETLESLNRHLLLEIDQLEEMFTTPGIDANQRAAFLRTVGDLCLSGRIWVVATMRSEFFPRVAEQPELFALVGKERGYILPPPDRQSLREIIRYPALAARLDFERRMAEIEIAGEIAKFEYLDDQILSDSESSPDALPLLEFTLQQLYEEKRGTLLTWEAYAAAGGLKGAIAKRAREVYDGLDPVAREARHRIFAALVHVDAARNTVTRQRALLEVLKAGPGAEGFLEAFLSNHLLVTDEDSQTGEAIVTLAHEALLSHWDELATWIKDHRGDLLARQRLCEQAHLWSQNDRKKTYLLSEARLFEAQRIATRDLFTLKPDEAHFLKLSEQRSRRKTRFLKTATAVFALVAIAAAGLGVMAKKQAKRANAESDRAARGERIANQQREFAVASQKNAEKRQYLAGIQTASKEIEFGRSDAARWTLMKLPKEQRKIEWSLLMEWAGAPMIRIKNLEDWLKRNQDLQPYLVSQIRAAENNLQERKDDALILDSPNMLFTAYIGKTSGRSGAYASVSIRDQSSLRAKLSDDEDLKKPEESIENTKVFELATENYGGFGKAAFTPDSSILLIEASEIREYSRPPIFNPGDDEGEYFLVPIPFRVLPYTASADEDRMLEFTICHGREIIASAGGSWTWKWPVGGRAHERAINFSTIGWDLEAVRGYIGEDEVFHDESVIEFSREELNLLPSHIRLKVANLMRRQPNGPRRNLAAIKWDDVSAEALFMLVEDTALLERWDLISNKLIGRLGQGISASNVFNGFQDWGAAYSPDGSRIIACPVAERKGRLVAGVFNSSTGALIQEVPGMEFEVHGRVSRPYFGFSPNGEFVFASILEAADPTNHIHISKKVGEVFGRAEAPLKLQSPNFLAWSPSGAWRFEVNDMSETLKVISTTENSYFPIPNAVEATPYPLFYKFRNRTGLVDGRYCMGEFVFLDESPEPILKLPIVGLDSKFRSAVFRNPKGGFDLVTGYLEYPDERMRLLASMALLKWWIDSVDLEDLSKLASSGNIKTLLPSKSEAAEAAKNVAVRYEAEAYAKLKGNRAGEERQFEIAPGLIMTFCWCPSGEFLMGSPDSEEGRIANEEQVNVTLSKGFWMAKTEVTQAQWEALMGTNPSEFKGDNRPVENVSWDDAQEYLAKLNARLGNADGGTMVLPTEAQWEYAARAGQTGVYSGGSLDEVAWHIGNSGIGTNPVGTKETNAWGLQDMSGNVWEWCLDWYEDRLPGGSDPRGPDSGARRVGRGGSWYGKASDCGVASRTYFHPADQLNNLGFRIARSSVP